MAFKSFSDQLREAPASDLAEIFDYLGDMANSVEAGSGDEGKALAADARDVADRANAIADKIDAA